MQLFLKRLFIFTLTTFIFIISIYSIFTFLVEKNANFRFNGDIEYIMFGASQPECAYNDSLIDDFKNFAKSGESYFYNYPKVKYALMQNPNVNTFFIEFSNRQIMKEMDDAIWDDARLSNNYSILFPLIELSDSKFLLFKNRKGFLHGLSISLKHQVAKVVTNNYNFKNFGGYVYLKRDKIDSLLLNDDSSKVKNDKPLQYSYANIAYLQKIVNFCGQNNKKLYFVRTPQHINGKYIRNESSFQDIMNNTFGNIELLDFNNFPLEDSDFGDFYHLNYRGARKFSIWFNDLLKEGLLQRTDKQDYIDRKILEYRADLVFLP